MQPIAIQNQQPEIQKPDPITQRIRKTDQIIQRTKTGSEKSKDRENRPGKPKNQETGAENSRNLLKSLIFHQQPDRFCTIVTICKRCNMIDQSLHKRDEEKYRELIRKN